MSRALAESQARERLLRDTIAGLVGHEPGCDGERLPLDLAGRCLCQTEKRRAALALPRDDSALRVVLRAAAGGLPPDAIEAQEAMLDHRPPGV